MDSARATRPPAVRIDPEFHSLIPALSVEERVGLESDILRDGRATVPLVVWNGLLLDGHHRLEICRKHGLPYTTQEAPEWIKDRRDARIWTRANALNKRNLGPVTRAELASGNEEDIASKNAEKTGGRPKKPVQKSAQVSLSVGASDKALGEASHEAATAFNLAVHARLSQDERKTRTQAAKSAGMSHPTYAAAKQIAKSPKATPELKRAVDRGEIAVSTGLDLMELPADRQREVAALGKRAAKEAVKALRADRTEKNRQDRVTKIAEISKKNTPLTGKLGTFPVIYADPPWTYEHEESASRSVKNHYPVMDLDDICALPVASIASKDAWLFLWATSPKLAEALRVIAAWGFDYRTCAVWVKPSIGMGYVYRQRHELLLVAKRGSPPTPSPADRPDSVIEAPDGEHSEKPDVARKQIERMFPKWKRVELFCRDAKPGWSVWGNQAGGK